jgi:hypothetical protein
VKRRCSPGHRIGPNATLPWSNDSPSGRGDGQRLRDARLALTATHIWPCDLAETTTWKTATANNHWHRHDVVITMGCGDACPVDPGKRYEDWQLEDPSGKDLAAVRRIRDDIDARDRAHRQAHARGVRRQWDARVL